MMMNPELQAALLGAIVGVIGALVGLIPVVQSYVKKRLEIATAEVQIVSANQQKEFQSKIEERDAITDNMRAQNANMAQLIIQLGRMVDSVKGIEGRIETTDDTLGGFTASLEKLLQFGSAPVQRIDSNTAMLVHDVEQVKDIAIATADANAANQEIILKALEQIKLEIVTTINNAITEIRAAIQKRQTGGDSKPIPAIKLDEVKELTKEN